MLMAKMTINKKIMSNGVNHPAKGDVPRIIAVRGTSITIETIARARR
jgi:hypothetical protein